MSEDRDDTANSSGEPDKAASTARREALIKLGKYTAYATPIVIASLSAAHAGPGPISGPTPPPPP